MVYPDLALSVWRVLSLELLLVVREVIVDEGTINKGYMLNNCLHTAINVINMRPRLTLSLA
jgi:hypothetical protein